MNVWGWLTAGGVGFVAYVIVGYPLLVAGIAQLRRAPTRTAGLVPSKLSLIIAAYDEASAIVEKLRNSSTLERGGAALEVIVVADGSQDGTERLARESGLASAVLYESERRGKAAALNRGVEAATGEILVFSDANNMYEPRTLLALAECFADPGVGVVTGRKVIAQRDGESLDRTEGAYWRYESRLKEWESRAGSVTGVCGEVLALRREAFKPLREGSVNDDFILAMQAALEGWRVIYAADAVSTEKGSADLDAETVRRSRIVAGRWQALAWLLPRLLARRPVVAWQVLSHKAFRPLVPFAMLLVAVASLLWMWTTPWAGVLVALQAAFYAAALKGRSDNRKGKKRLITYLPYYFCRVNLSALTGTLAFLRRREQGRWTRVARADD